MEDTNDMILDMDTFDFSMLDEGDVEVKEVEVKKASKVEEASEDEDLFEEEFEETEEVEETEEESEEEEVEEVEEEEEDSEEETEESEDDEEEVDYESYELSLPSGETVVLADLVNGYKAAKEVEAARAEVEALKTDFESKASGLERALNVARLEAQMAIDDYDGFDWAALKPEDYVAHREYLDSYQKRLKEINTSFTEIEGKKAAEEERITAEKTRAAVAELSRDIPGWGPEVYRSLIEYAVEKGADKDAILNSTDAFTFKLLHKAMEHDKGVLKVKAKVKKVGSPKKVVKAAAAKPKTTTVNPKKMAILKRVEAGDVTGAFDFLED